MNISDYEKLLMFSNKLAPMATDFADKTAYELKNIFGFYKAEICIFSKNSCINWGIPDSNPEDHYHRDIILLKNKNNDYIGYLSIYQYKSISSKNHNLITEITKLVEHALQIHIQLYKLNADIKLLTSLVCHLPVAVILCDDNFHILHINQAAKNYINLFCKDTTINDVDKILQNTLLSEFINSGENRYSMSVGEYELQLSIKSYVINDINKGYYTTCYQIIINCTSTTGETKWKDFLINRKLTKRECEISNLLRLGYTNDEIASSLHISTNTIKRHRESIYRKLGIKRINQLNVLYENSISRK